MPSRLPSDPVTQLVNGTKGPVTIKDLRQHLQNHQDNPFLYRELGNLLLEKKSYIEATKTLRSAYTIFIKQGMSMQGLAALLKSWEVVRPAPFDLRNLHVTLKRRDSHCSAVAECFAKMSYPELVSILDKITPVHYPAGHQLCRPGDTEEILYFIISGEVLKSAVNPKKLSALDESSLAQNTEILGPDDHFGDLYPCGTTKKATHYFVTRCRTELFKISKEDLLTICGEHPDIETGLKNLVKDQSVPNAIKPLHFHRKSSRQSLTIILNIEIFGRKPGLTPIVIKGFSNDISLGGVCVIVDPRYRDIPIEDISGRSAKIRISLPDETVSLTIMGKLAWCQETEIDNEKTSALGIQFNEMPPRLRGLLIIFANTVGTMTRNLAGDNFSQDQLAHNQPG